MSKNANENANANMFDNSQYVTTQRTSKGIKLMFAWSKVLVAAGFGMLYAAGGDEHSLWVYPGCFSLIAAFVVWQIARYQKWWHHD